VGLGEAVGVAVEVNVADGVKVWVAVAGLVGGRGVVVDTVNCGIVPCIPVQAVKSIIIPRIRMRTFFMFL